MTQRDNKSRTLYGKSSLTPRLRIARRAVFLMALNKLLWSTDALARGVPASRPITQLVKTANWGFGTYEIAAQ